MSISARRFSSTVILAAIPLVLPMSMSPATAAGDTSPSRQVASNSALRATAASHIPGDAWNSKAPGRGAPKDVPQTGADFEIDGNGKLVRYKGSASTVRIPGSVKAIGQEAFAETGVAKVTIPATVTEIEAMAFQGCKNLTAVEFENTQAKPSQLAKVGRGAFERSRLGKVELPDSVTVVEDSAFAENPELVKVHFGKGVRAVGEALIDESSKVREVTVAEGNSFLSVDRGVALYAKYQEGLHLIAFGQGKGLSDYRVKDGTTKIGRGAFNGNAALKKIYLPDGLKQIEMMAFQDAKALEEVRFPDSLEAVTGFGKTESLHKVDFGTHIASLDSAFLGVTPERLVVRGGNNGKFRDNKVEGDETGLNIVDLNASRPAAAYFGEGMTDITYRYRFPKVLVLPSTLKKFSINKEKTEDAWRSEAIFYVAANPGSTAWKLAEEQMSNAGMDPAKQLKRYRPMNVTARPGAASANGQAAKVDVRGGVDRGILRVRAVTVAADGTTKGLSDWTETKSAGGLKQANVTYKAPVGGGKVKIEAMDHTGLSVLADISQSDG